MADTNRSVDTYHCICTHLLLALTRPLQDLPRRTTLDKSIILRVSSTTNAPESLSEYATLLGTNADRDAVVVRGGDGFEKRYLHKCARCKVVVGYMLDWAQFNDAAKQSGKRDDVVYLLPGGTVMTKDMADGKDVGLILDLER